MQDERGLYYFPNPLDHKLRVYVRQNGDEIEFRLFHEETPEIWERHPWLNYDVLVAADSLYKKERNAKAEAISIYDLNVARALLSQDKINKK
ncbi:MAG: hypothetical protein IJS50_01380 [Desulfovibrio sp.]|nr:hypothetical protein [Desulfovibrio sp.]